MFEHAFGSYMSHAFPEVRRHEARSEKSIELTPSRAGRAKATVVCGSAAL